MNQQQCRHCGATFSDETERDHHWYQDHDRDELTDEELRAAVDEIGRRYEDHTFPVNVEVGIPREAWEFLCERLAVDPAETDPNDLEDHLRDLMDLEFEFAVGEPDVGTTVAAWEEQ